MRIKFFNLFESKRIQILLFLRDPNLSLNFFLMRGLLFFGLPFTSVQLFLKWQEGNKINFIALILSGIIAGLIYSGSMWYFAERKFKKERNEEHGEN